MNLGLNNTRQLYRFRKTPVLTTYFVPLSTSIRLDYLQVSKQVGGYYNDYRSWVVVGWRAKPYFMLRCGMST